MNKQEFTIPGRLPGYNELNKSNWRASYKVKRDAMDRVCVAIRASRLEKITGPIVVTIACYEPNAKRDVDNVISGASKVILDSLQLMGVLPNDNRKFVKQMIYPEPQVDKENPRVEVVIEPWQEKES